MNKKLEVTVSDAGVQFGNAWLSHERITGYTAEQLNSGNCCITGNQYMKWLSQEAAQSELAALREELAERKRKHLRSCQIAIGKSQLAKELQAKLTAAEQRNAFLEAQVSAKDIGIDFHDAMISAVSMSEDTALMAWVPSDWEAKRRTLLSNAKPTESGASNKCVSDGGTCGLGGQCSECPHKESEASE